MSLRALLIKGSSLRIAHLLITMVISIFMMPFLVRSLGDEMYGVWVLVSTFVGYYGLLDLGLSSAVTRFVSRAIGSDDIDDIRGITSTAFWIFCGIGVAALIITIILAPLYSHLVHAPWERHVFQLALLIIGLDFALSMPVRMFNGALVSNFRYDVSTGLAIFRAVLSTALIYMVVSKGMGILSMAVVQLCTSLAVYILEGIYTIRFVPSVSLRWKDFRPDKLRTMLSYSVYTFISQIADILRFRIDTVVIAAFLGPTRVTVYFIAARLVEYFIQFVTNIVGVMAPVFSQYEGRRDYEAIKEKFFLTTKISTVCAVLFGGLVVFFGKPFIERWMGPRYTEAYPLLLILVIPTALALMQVPSINLLYGISKHKFYTYANTIEGLLNLALSLILVRRLGLVGVAVGTAIPMVLMKLICQPIYVCRAVGISYRRYVSTVGKAFVLSLAAMFLPWLLLKNLVAISYRNIFTLGGINAGLYMLLVFIFVFNKMELGVIHPRLMRFRR